MMKINETVKEIVSTVLGRKINEEASMGEEPLWDSLKHIEIIMTIEEELGISFEVEDIPKLTSIKKIITKLNEKS